MGLYRWNCGGQYRGKSWEQDLLADSQVCKVKKFPSVKTAEKGHTCICGPIFAGHFLHSGKMCVPKLKRLRAKIATRHRVFRFPEAKCLTGEEAGKSGCLKTRLVKLKKNSESTAIE